MKYCGRNFRIAIETAQGSDEFVIIVGDQSSSMTSANEMVDVSDKDTMPNRALVACGVNSQTINISGVLNDDNSLWLVHDSALAGDLRQYQVLNEAGLVYQGFFLCASFERSGDHNGAEMFSCVLEGSPATGFVPHFIIKQSGASPDGLVGLNGQIEIKCPNTATHIKTFTSGTIDKKYRNQMTWQMACTGRHWCDFVSYGPRLPAEYNLCIIRFERDDEEVKQMELKVKKFLGDLEDKLSEMTANKEKAIGR